MRAKCTGCNEVFESPTFDGFSPCNGGRIVEIKTKITRKEWKQRAKRAEGNESASALAYKRVSALLEQARSKNLSLIQRNWDLIAEIDAANQRANLIKEVDALTECRIPDCGCPGDRSHP